MRITLFIVLLLLPGFIHAQIGFGPEIGIGVSTMRFAPDLRFTSANHSAIFSYRVGGLVDVKFTSRIYFQAGIAFSHKGQYREFSFYSSDTLNAAAKQTLTLNYAEAPLAVLYKTGAQGRGRVILGVGATPAYIIGGRNKLHLYGADSGRQFDNKTNNPVTSDKPVAMFDIGITLTAGYELPTGLFFRGYYTAGTKDIGLGTEIDKNRAYGIAAGYIFGKGRNINKEVGDLIDKGTD
jgi:hypothetical protein